MPRARKRFHLVQHEEQPEAEDDSCESSTYIIYYILDQDH